MLPRMLVLVSLMLPLGSIAQQIDLRWTEVADVAGVVDIVHAGDGSGRLYLVRQAGDILVLQNGSLRATPFADFGALIDAGGEQGLLSVAFAPGFPATPHLFAWYYAGDAAATVLARFTVDTGSMTVDPATRQELLRVTQPFENHNGGKLLFGPDGMLYLSIGDGGGSGDPFRNAQDRSNLLGTVIRLDVGTLPYAIPAGNPFAGQAGMRPEIWSYGLRNPWRMSFDRATGELYIADVGQATSEEINVQPAGVGGQNWGWSCFEGSFPFPDGGACSGAMPTPPAAEYGRNNGCSITGGYVYRGSRHPALQGIYLSGDFCTGRIFGVKFGSGGFNLTTLVDTPLNISTFGEDEAGELYVADLSGGVFKLSDGDPQADGGGQVGTQFWVVGNGTVAQRTLSAEMTSATGTAFGSAFDPDAVQRARWGSIEIEFTGCDSAQLRWTSTGTDSAGFGTGSYPLVRLGSSTASQRCNAQGFAAADDLEWVTGTWFGGEARDGEGIFLDRLANGVVLVAFFTHRPAGTQ